MTETDGFPPAEPDDTQAAVAEADETQAATPEPEPDDDTAEAPEAAEAVTEPPAEAAPFIPTEGVQGWLRDALLGLHRRIANSGH